MFGKFKRFWDILLDSIKTAYNRVYRAPVKTDAQAWRDLLHINFLDIFVEKLNNLVNNEATFSIKSDGSVSKPVSELCEDIEAKKFNITAHMLADGDYYVFPALDAKGKLIHSYLTQQQVRILDTDGDKIIEAAGIIDWYVDKQSRVYYLLRQHKLDKNGTLTVSYKTVTEDGKTYDLERWAHLKDEVVSFANANHIGFGRYKSPVSSRGCSPVYGVPLNFGCADIEKRITDDLKFIKDEFKNGKSVIFTDPRNLLTDKEKKGYYIAENVIPVKNTLGKDGKNIDIFNPNLRWSEHYGKLVADLALYEKQVGTSKGILTENETAYTSTATAVRRANADTLALIGKIRNAIDSGNRMTLEADCVFLNIPVDAWEYQSDWWDPFADSKEQWQQLQEAFDAGAAEERDLVRWTFPNLDEDAIEEKLSRISEQKKKNSDDALEKIISGG